MTLCLHRGSRLVAREELELIDAPEGTDTWFPARHSTVLETVEDVLKNAGFEIAKSEFALSKDDAQMFATLDLTTPIVDGVSLAVGVRNANDKKFPLGLTAGSRVFVCDNLAFSSQIYVSKRHTRFGKDRFDEGISRAMQNLGQYRQMEAKRIEHYKSFELDETDAACCLLHAYEQEILPTTLLDKAISEWREPSHEEFRERTMFSMMQAVTEVLKSKRNNPQKFAALTMKMYGLLDRESKFQAV